MKKTFANIFVILAALSFVCVVVGGMGLMIGAVVQFSTPSRANSMMQVGAGIADVGLVGVALFGWLLERSQTSKQDSVTLLTVLRRAGRNRHS